MDNLVTFKEIMAFTNLTHNAIDKKMRKLGIKPVTKIGHSPMYTRADMERIDAYRPQPYNPKTNFYRVSINMGFTWIVTHAGLTQKNARKIVSEYETKGLSARFTCCG